MFADPVSVLMILYEKFKEKRKNLYVAFIDLEKVYAEGLETV